MARIAEPRTDVECQRGGLVPGDFLGPLVRLRMNGSEWRIVVSTILSPEAVTAVRLARDLKLDYGRVKQLVRGLVAWKILERTPTGLPFRPESACWGPPESKPARPARPVRVEQG
jgi:hypothetical protein